MTKKFWGNQILKLTPAKETAVKALISTHLPDDNGRSFIRSIIFSPSTTINWFLAAKFFSEENPHLRQDILNIVYCDDQELTEMCTKLSEPSLSKEWEGDYTEFQTRNIV